MTRYENRLDLDSSAQAVKPRQPLPCACGYASPIQPRLNLGNRPLFAAGPVPGDLHEGLLMALKPVTAGVMEAPTLGGIRLAALAVGDFGGAR